MRIATARPRPVAADARAATYGTRSRVAPRGRRRRAHSPPRRRLREQLVTPTASVMAESAPAYQHGTRIPCTVTGRDSGSERHGAARTLARIGQMWVNGEVPHSYSAETPCFALVPRHRVLPKRAASSAP
eukprot:359300-Chlamydomonas_euryale.AAC.8